MCEAANAESVMKHKRQFCCTIRFLFISGIIKDTGKVKKEKKEKGRKVLQLFLLRECQDVCDVDPVQWLLKPASSQTRMHDMHPSINAMKVFTIRI